jgi:hypothetical protein
VRAPDRPTGTELKEITAMTPTDTRVALVDAATMRDRITALDQHLGERLTPRLSGKAGQMLEPIGVVLAVQLAVVDYAQDAAAGMPGPMASMLRRTTEMRIPEVLRTVVAEGDAQAVLDAYALVNPS